MKQENQESNHKRFHWVNDAPQSKDDDELKNILKITRLIEITNFSSGPDKTQMYYSAKLTSGDFKRMDELKQTFQWEKEMSQALKVINALK